MFTALYYPHTTMSEAFIKNAIFLWDRVEYIAPNEDFQPSYKDAEVAEAVRTFAAPYVPTDETKTEANDAILELLDLGLPEWFFVEQVPERLRYPLYQEKLFLNTWDRLEQAGLAKHVGERFETTAAFGLAVMAILADCCAGTQKRLVTDEAGSYSALDRYLATIGGADLGKFDDESERLVTVSLKILKIMDFKNVSLSRLTQLREKEKSSSGATLTQLRHGYLKKIEEYADKLLEARSKQDVNEIERVFEQEMKEDFELLKDELKDEAKKVVLSNVLKTAAIVLAGSFVQPVIGLLLAGGALYKKKVEYHAARNKLLKGHPMSWLYSMRRFQL